MTPTNNQVPSPSTHDISKFVLFQAKSPKFSKTSIKTFITLIILVAGAFTYIYLATDLIIKPVQGLTSASGPGEWAMFRHDPGHSGTADTGDILPQGNLKWIFSTGTTIHSSPAIADGKIYFGNRNNKVYSVDAATGEKLWEFQAESWVDSSPAVVNGMVYFGSNDGNIYALDSASGEKIWSFNAGFPVTSSPAIADGILYIGTDNYNIYALDATTGDRIWAFDTDGLVKSSPVVSNGIVYVGTNASYLYALDAINGRVRLKFRTAYPIYSSPVINDGTIYFVNSNGYLTAVNGTARTWIREHEIRPYWTQMWLMGIPLIPMPKSESGLIWGTRLDPASTSSPAASGDTLYVGMKEKLIAVDLNDQQQTWEFITGGIITASPAVTDAAVYVASADGYLYALNPDNGEKLWDIFIGGRLTSSPAIAEGTIYIGAHDGNLYAIE